MSTFSKRWFRVNKHFYQLRGYGNHWSITQHDEYCIVLFDQVFVTKAETLGLAKQYVKEHVVR